MSEQQAAILRPETLVEEFKKNGVTHVLTIPDSETNYLYELMKEQPWLTIVPTAREGETFANGAKLQSQKIDYLTDVQASSNSTGFGGGR